MHTNRNPVRRLDRVLRIIVVAMLALLVTAPAVQAGRPTSAFTGHWEATDPLDGSNLDAYIFAVRHLALILYTDDAATGACEDLSYQVFTSFLTGTIDGDELNSTMRWARCGKVHLPFGGLEITWTLDDLGDTDPSNDILANSFDEFYSRVP
jgi:hypothetical protein